MSDENAEMKLARKSIEELRERVDRLADVVEKGKGEVEEFAKTNPMVALGVAFLLGAATGTIVAATISHRR